MIVGMVFYSLEDESPLALPEYRATRRDLEWFDIPGLTHILDRGSVEPKSASELIDYNLTVRAERRAEFPPDSVH
jgi:hypothetical protein